MSRNTLFLFLCFVSFILKGQIDTTFWFSAPNISAAHGDRPIYFRFATFDTPTVVIIKLPSSDVTVTTLEIPANSQASYLVENPDLFETEAGNIQNNGVKIESTAPITAYYEILGPTANNTDIFALKGKYGLGTEFIVPVQNLYPNRSGLEAYNTIQVVATEDNTEIQIFPTSSVLLFDDQSPITITLNRGQTYSFQSTGTETDDKLAGTRIISNKPIAVTGSDDSVFYGNHWDLIGDQLIPFNIAGTRYVLPIGHIAISSKNDLDLEINGSSYSLNISNNHSVTFFNDTPVFIEASDTIIINYIDAFYDLGDGGGELGGAILPPITCSGSREVAFIRSTEQEFWLHLIYRTSSQNDFILNGVSLDINQSVTYSVDDNLSYTKIRFDSDEIGVNLSHRIQNSSAPFHLSTASGGINTGFQLGYFSNFRNELEDTIYTCQDYQNLSDLYLELGLYGEIGIDTIIAKNEDSSYVEFTVEDEYCTEIDTAWLIKSSNPEILIADTLTYCSDIDSTISVDGYRVYFNGFGQSNDYLIDSNLVSIFVENEVGCNTQKTVHINFLDSLSYLLPNDTFFCEGTEVDLVIETNATASFVNNFPFNQTITVNSDSTLNISLENECDAFNAIVEVTQLKLPIIELGPDREVCSLENPNIKLPDGYTYLWYDGDTSSEYQIYQSALHQVSVTDSLGCIFNDVVNITFKNIGPIPIITDQKICNGNTYEIQLPLGHDSYSWNDGINEPNRSLDSGFYQLEVNTFVNDTLCYQQEHEFLVSSWDLKIPNVITPNGDDKNETFIIRGLDNDFPLQVKFFNRWNKEIYSNDNYKNEWGSDPSISFGVYYYYAESFGFDCTITKGHLTVIK